MANTSCCLCIIVNIMHVVFSSTNRYGSFFIPTVHNLDISEFWFLSTHPLWITFVICSSITYQYFSHLQKFLHSMSLTVHNKWRDYAQYMNRSVVMQHAHYSYVTCEHVTPPVTYTVQYLQSVRCGTQSQNIKHVLHTATDFVSQLCGSNRILFAGFSVL